jgi:hypothetical protein
MAGKLLGQADADSPLRGFVVPSVRQDRSGLAPPRFRNRRSRRAVISKPPVLPCGNHLLWRSIVHGPWSRVHARRDLAAASCSRRARPPGGAPVPRHPCPCPAVPGRFCGSAGRIRARNMAVGHALCRPFRAQLVVCCFSRGFTPGWYVTRFQRWCGRRDGGGRCSRGPAVATTVGRSAKAGRLQALQGVVTAEDPPSPRPLVVQAMKGKPRAPAHAAHLVSHLVGLGRISAFQLSACPADVPDERGPRQEPLYHGYPCHASAARRCRFEHGQANPGRNGASRT